MQRVQVHFLVGELSSLTGHRNENINNRSSIVTNSIKTLKMVYIKRKKRNYRVSVPVYTVYMFIYILGCMFMYVCIYIYIYIYIFYLQMVLLN